MNFFNDDFRQFPIISVIVPITYGEDAYVNEVKDTQGNLIPCRVGNLGMPQINLHTGQIINWNIGTKAYIHYKVCDSGEYYLSYPGGKVYKYINHYVPDIIDCSEDHSSYGDYIIGNVNEQGYIQNGNSQLELSEGKLINKLNVWEK